MCDGQQRGIDPLAQVICISKQVDAQKIKQNDAAYCLVDTNLGFIQASVTGKISASQIRQEHVGIILKNFMHYLTSPDHTAQKQSIGHGRGVWSDSRNRCLIQRRSKTKAVYWLKSGVFYLLSLFG